jgi:hypothetical protein
MGSILSQWHTTFPSRLKHQIAVSDTFWTIEMIRSILVSLTGAVLLLAGGSIK